jgi:hypothetical protein
MPKIIKDRKHTKPAMLEGGGAGAASAPGGGADGLELEVEDGTVRRPWFRYKKEVTNWYRRLEGELAPLDGVKLIPCVVRIINNTYYVVREDFIRSNEISTLDNTTTWRKNAIGVLTAVRTWSWRGPNITGAFKSLLMTCCEPLCGASLGNIYNLDYQCEECGEMQNNSDDERELRPDEEERAPLKPAAKPRYAPAGRSE